ncbi:MAG TPA: sigma-70 family RNA polymerase sigma factor [Verrucomicrobiae bacterium]|jgi:RNA polymerase sigma factor (sigma-70 family)|nr:sigma-70 family RNA polymerase sigma factor [Verrucomicrobiae bacterium]
MNDLDLLRQYTEEASEEAFAALVQRHLNLVYATALRQVRSPQLAEEVSQTVFLTLAKNARSLRPDTILAAWLYRVARRAAIDVVRGEARREQREQIALDLANMKSDSSEWMRIEGLLDEVLETLEEPDRNAILLRFFQNKSLREVGEILGTSEEAARKRVSRAVEQLREVFARRGIEVGAAGLVALLGAQALHGAPIGLSATISAAAFSGAAVIHPVTTLAATKAIAMTLIQKTLVTAVLAAAVGTGIYEARQASQYQEQAVAAQRQQDALAQQNLQLQSERDDATNQIATLRSEAAKFRSSTSEIVKLRREVARLRDASKAFAQRNATAAANENDPIDTEMKSWADRSKKLREMVAQKPDQQIPEFKLLKDKDWIDSVKDLSQLETDADYAKAIDELKGAAKGEFANAVQDAFNKFSQGNSGQTPTDFSQLKPYLGDAGDDSILQGYQFTGPGAVSQKPNFQTDADGNFYASTLQITPGSVQNGVNSGDDLKQPILAFAAANPGQTITDPAQLLPYVQTEAEKKALQQLIQTAAPPKMKCRAWS